MKRCLVRICVFLILGAIVNVAVAWICALSPEPAQSHEFELEKEVVKQMISARGVPVCSDDEPWGGRRRSIGVTVTVLVHDASERQGLSLLCIVMEAGIPFRGIRGELISRGSTVEVQFAYPHLQIACEIADPNQVSRTRVGILPLTPIWPGFAMNTVFYAAMMWMIFAAPFALRRRSRRRRGLCVKCGYDLRGGRGAGSTGGPDAITCPECGATR